MYRLKPQTLFGKAINNSAAAKAAQGQTQKQFQSFADILPVQKAEEESLSSQESNMS
jgi:hypothetical protein